MSQKQQPDFLSRNAPKKYDFQDTSTPLFKKPDISQRSLTTSERRAFVSCVGIVCMTAVGLLSHLWHIPVMGLVIVYLIVLNIKPEIAEVDENQTDDL